MTDLTDLVGSREIAEMASVAHSTVKVWRTRHQTFPAPVRRFGRSDLWDRADVAAWLAATGRGTPLVSSWSRASDL